MPNIIIEIPDEKIQLVKDWVDSRTNAGIVEGWSDAQYAAYVDSYITSHFRAQVYNYQQNEYTKNFVFDDPTSSG